MDSAHHTSLGGPCISRTGYPLVLTWGYRVFTPFQVEIKSLMEIKGYWGGEKKPQLRGKVKKKKKALIFQSYVVH